MARDSFSRLRLGALHISLQIRKTQPRGWKKRTNEHGLGSAPSVRKGESVTLYVLWANVSVYSNETPTKATSHADFCWLYPSPSLDCSLEQTDLFCPSWSTELSLSSLGPSFPSSLSVSQKISPSGPLCGFRAKTDRVSLTDANTNGNKCNLLCQKGIPFHYIPSYGLNSFTTVHQERLFWH